MLLAADHGVLVVSGLELAGVDRFAEALQSALPQRARLLDPISALATLDEPALRRAVDAATKQMGSGLNFVVFGPSCAWAPDLPFRAAQLLEARKERDRLLRIVFVADGHAAWRWREAAHNPESGAADEPTVARARIREIALLPWTTETIRRWIDENGAPGGQHEAGQSLVWEATGGFAPALETLLFNDREPASGLVAHVDAVFATATADPLGDWPRSAHTALREIAQVARPGETFEVGLLSHAAPGRTEAQRIVSWAEWIGAVQATAPGVYRLNPLVHRLLARASA